MIQIRSSWTRFLRFVLSPLWQSPVNTRNKHSPVGEAPPKTIRSCFGPGAFLPPLLPTLLSSALSPSALDDTMLAQYLTNTVALYGIPIVGILVFLSSHWTQQLPGSIPWVGGHTSTISRFVAPWLSLFRGRKYLEEAYYKVFVRLIAHRPLRFLLLL